MGKLKCKKEAIGDSGKKIMQFTEGVIYDFEYDEQEDCWIVLDDNGRREVFFDTSIMFKKV